MADRWLKLTLMVSRDQVPAAELALEVAGALVSWTEAAGNEQILEPAPGTTPLWAEVKLTGLFPEEADRPAILAVVEPLVPGAGRQAAFDHVDDRDWDAEWRRQLKPLRFGRRLWVCPVGQRCPDPGAVSLVLEPGLAFGTGTHPTTAMCLEWLDRTDLAGRRLLDYGCGSGILALAALALGAASAVGVDIDPQALVASRENARRNGQAGGLVLAAALDGDGARPGFDVVVANILSGPLIRLAPELCGHARPAADLALSGILAGQADEVRQAFAAWVRLDTVAESGGWVLLAGRMPG
jgi:ribosomal protein L11 methyltransferase